MNILVVDDQPEYRLLLKSLLSEYGWVVFSAEDGEDALQAMARVPMDLIISDIYMPVMDGFKFHQTVRSIPGCEKLPFLFVSAYDDEFTVNAVRNPRCEAFLKKTASIDSFIAWIEYFALSEDKRPKNPPSTESTFGHSKLQYAFGV